MLNFDVFKKNFLMKKPLPIPLFFGFMILWSTVAMGQEVSYLDSLQSLLRKTLEDTLRVQINNKIAYYYDSDSIQVARYAGQAITLSKQINYPEGVADGFTNLAWASMQRGYYPISKSQYQEALKYALLSDYKKGQARAYNGIGMIYELQGNNSNALDAHLNALQILKDIGYKKGMAASYNNIANIYLNQENYSSALAYYEKALAIDLEEGDQYSSALVYNNIGNIYRSEKKYDRALNYYNKSLKIKSYQENKRDLASAYNNIGTTYGLMGDYQKAIEFNLQSIELYKEANVKTRLAYPLIALGKAHSGLGQYSEAIRYINEGIGVGKEIGEMLIIADGLEALSETYAAQKDFEKAHQNAVLFKRYEDSMNAAEVDKKIAQIEAEFLFQKERDSIQSREEVLKRDIRNRKNIQFATTMCVILLLMVLLGGVRLYRIKQKSNLQVLDQKEKIEKQNEQLQELNLVKDRIFSIIAHDLKSPIVNLQSLLHLFKEDRGLSEENKERYMLRVAKNVAGISDLLNNLLYWARFQMQGKLQLNPQSLDLNVYLRESAEQFSDLTNEKKLELNLEQGEHLPPALVDAEVLRFLIRNLLNNACKFSRQGGQIILRSENNQNGFIRVSVTDNGIGVDKEKQKKIFHEIVESQVGTSSEKGTGLGLYLCREFVEQSGGRIGLTSHQGEGSCFWILLPLSKTSRVST